MFNYNRIKCYQARDFSKASLRGTVRFCELILVINNENKPIFSTSLPLLKLRNWTNTAEVCFSGIADFFFNQSAEEKKFLLINDWWTSKHLREVLNKFNFGLKHFYR